MKYGELASHQVDLANLRGQSLDAFRIEPMHLDVGVLPWTAQQAIAHASADQKSPAASGADGAREAQDLRPSFHDEALREASAASARCVARIAEAPRPSARQSTPLMRVFSKLMSVMPKASTVANTKSAGATMRAEWRAARMR